MHDPHDPPRWTQADITSLRELLSTGSLMNGLVTALHRSESDIVRMAKRLRLPMTH